MVRQGVMHMFDTANIFTIGGTVQAGGGIYIGRAADAELLALCRAGTFTYILAARQMGKSSLMTRTADQLADEGIRTVKLDLTRIGTNVSIESWYFGILFEIRRQLRLSLNLMEWWRTYADLGFTQRLSLFFEQVLVQEVSGQVVIFIDEIDTTLSLDFTDDFYAAVRALYVERARTPQLARLSFVLIGVATPSDLIRDPKRTPFNIGQRVEMRDFTLDEALPLADGLGVSDDAARRVLNWIMEWTGGHPYLTQRLCLAVAEAGARDWTEATIAHLVRQTFFTDNAGQDSNVGFVRDMLTKRAPDVAGVLETYRAIWKNKPKIADEEQSLIKNHLKLSGVVRRDGLHLRVRNRIYQTAFNERWIRDHLPVNWARQIRRALGVIAVLLTLLVVVGGLSVYAFVQQREAETQARAATQRRQEAEALALSFRAQTVDDPELGVLLARAAARGLQKAGLADSTGQVGSVLRQALADSRVRATLRANAGAVKQALFSPDGRSILTTYSDGSARLWQSSTGTLRATLTGHSRSITAATFSPDGTRIVTTSDDNTARVWDVATGVGVTTYAAHSAPVKTVAFSPDGQTVLTGSADGTARLWATIDGATKQVFASRETMPIGYDKGITTLPVTAVLFSLDGTQAFVGCGDVSSGNGGLFQWDVRSGVLLGRYVDDGRSPVVAARLNPDGSQLLSLTALPQGNTNRYYPRLWDTAAHVLRQNLITDSATATLTATFSPDGRRIVWAGAKYSADSTGTQMAQPFVEVWDERAGRTVATLVGHDKIVNSAQFSPDGKQVVTASDDATARIWDTTTGREIIALRGHSASVTGATFSPDGRTVLTASSDGTARIWATDATSELPTSWASGASATAVALSNDGQRLALAYADGTVAIVDGRSGAERRKLTARNGLITLDFSPDGMQLATAGDDGTLQLWDTTNGALRATLSGHTAAISQIVFSPNGTRLATVGGDSTLRLWDGRNGAALRVWPTASDVYSLAFSPDSSRIVAAGYDNLAHVWDVATGAEIVTLRGHQSWLSVAAYSPDGTHILTASADGTARLWDARTGHEQRVLQLHSQAIRAATFSPDGTLIVTASDDGTARLWQTASGKDIAVLSGHSAAVTHVEFSPNGAFVITASRDGTARLWESGNGKAVAVVRGTQPVAFARFAADGIHIVTFGQEATARLVTCAVCGGLTDLVALADTQVTRDLNADERRQFGIAP